MDYSVEELKVDIDMIIREDGITPVLLIAGNLPEFRDSCKSIGICVMDFRESIECENIIAIVVENDFKFCKNASVPVIKYSNDYDTIDSAIHSYYLTKEILEK